jgi:hypothetical protein
MLLPTVLWAQRKDRLFLTIDLQEAGTHSTPQLELDNDETGDYLIASTVEPHHEDFGHRNHSHILSCDPFFWWDILESCYSRQAEGTRNGASSRCLAAFQHSSCVLVSINAVVRVLEFCCWCAL